MSSYFANVKFVPYKFGKSDTITLHQDLSAYVDLIDQVRDNRSFYQKYTILDGDRPDMLSQKLYGNTKYYWTFFLMNDSIRRDGWPLTQQELLSYAQETWDNTTLTTRDNINTTFKVGSTVTGLSSGASGKIVRKNLDLGQIVIEGSQNFTSTESIQTTEDGVIYSIPLVGAVAEYESVYQYVDSDNVPTDIDPYIGPGAQLAAVSHYDNAVNANDDLKEIIVIKPNSIVSIFEQFQSAMRS